MDLHLVVLPFVLAFSLASTNQCVSSPGSKIELSLHSLKNASGHWIITVDTRRFTMKENPRELTVKVHQETKLCDSNEIEQLVSVAFVHPSLNDTSMPGGTLMPTAPSTTTTTSAASTTTTAAPSTSITTTSTTTSATTPTSCPHSGYQLFEEFNCYKAFPSGDDEKPWCDARVQCRSDGGDLMVMETERERKDVYMPLCKSVTWSSWPWVGVHIPQSGDGWMTVNGKSALSTWWEPGEPDNNAALKCAIAAPTGLLENSNCAFTRPFICEIPV